MHYSCDLDDILINQRPAGKNELFRLLDKSFRAHAQCLIDAGQLAERLHETEKKAPFAVGQGIAIPNCQVDADLEEARHILVRLASPLPYETPDNIPVDLIFLLVSPESDGPLHLRRLSRLTRLMQDRAFAEHLRLLEDRKSIRGQFLYPEELIKRAA